MGGSESVVRPAARKILLPQFLADFPRKNSTYDRPSSAGNCVATPVDCGAPTSADPDTHETYSVTTALAVDGLRLVRSVTVICSRQRLLESPKCVAPVATAKASADSRLLPGN